MNAVNFLETLAILRKLYSFDSLLIFFPDAKRFFFGEFIYNFSTLIDRSGN